MWAAIDIGLFAYEDPPAREESQLRFSPLVAPLDRGGLVGVNGRF
jgi:hypothetical protein